MTTALRLELDSLDLDFADWATHGVVVSTVDLGFPAVREVMTNLSNQDGAVDETAFVGPRVVTITGNLGPCANGSRSAARNALAPFLAAHARPQLVVALDGDVDEFAITMRAADFTSVVGPGGFTQHFTASWKCADPLAYGTSINEIDVNPPAASSSGRTYPRIYPVTYPANAGGDGRKFITTSGNYQTWPVIEIDGPAVNPTIKWLDPSTKAPLGPQIVFAGFAIALGATLTIDTRARTVILNGDPNASRYSFLDFNATQWGPLVAGLNLLEFSSQSAPPPAVAKIRWQAANLI